MPKRLLLCVTGSVAAIKVSELVRAIREQEPAIEIRLVVTNNAKFFLNKAEADVGCPVYDDEAEWNSWNSKGDPVLHIELRKWCDLLVICPLSANTLAKIASGLCDNLVTSIVRAWDSSKRMIICPAMNSYMWENPITRKQLGIVRDLHGSEVFEPKQNYPLACGDVGPGALASVEDIVSHILRS